MPEDVLADMQSKTEALMKQNPKGLAVPAIKDLLTNVNMPLGFTVAEFPM